MYITLYKYMYKYTHIKTVKATSDSNQLLLFYVVFWSQSYSNIRLLSAFFSKILLHVSLCFLFLNMLCYILCGLSLLYVLYHTLHVEGLKHNTKRVSIKKRLDRIKHIAQYPSLKTSTCLHTSAPFTEPTPR